MQKRTTQTQRAAGASARALAGVALVALAALAGALNYYQSLSAYSRSGADALQVGAQLERLRDAAASIPPGVVVAYLSDVTVEDAASYAAFGAAQYALAPRLLVRFAEHQRAEWVIGDFFRAVDAAAVAREHGLALANDFGNGLVLFRRTR